MAGDDPYLKPVRIFDRYYGTDQMHLVAVVTTKDFRGGRSMDTWVSNEVRDLERIQYQRLESEIWNTAVNDDVALVHIRARIDTIVNEAQQSDMLA